MKVVYEKDIYEQIMDIKENAVRLYKTIDHIELTEREAKQLHQSPKSRILFPKFSSWRTVDGSSVCGITMKIKKENPYEF